MSREHLYKAKRKDWRELPKEEWWVEGCLLIDYVSGQYFIHANGNSVNESVKVNEEGCLKFFAYEVEPETVCEYTGLTDEGNKKVFENDVVRFKHGGEFHDKGIWYRNYVIEYINTFCTYGLRFRNKSIHFPCKQATVLMHDVEVIGNIFDNPELLEGGESE